MTRHSRSLSGLVGFIAVAGLSGCGDNTVQRECGPGTVVDDVTGDCVAAATCGPGTVESNGTCVPDGSVICGDGTVYNTATGECDPDPSVCGLGTVLVNGICIDEGIVAVDATEMPEPNDGDDVDQIAGTITVPAINTPGFVIHGCVDPYRDLDDNNNDDPDFDAWITTVSAPTALHITADGVRGLAAGFLAVGGPPEVAFDGWQRFGVNLVNDTSERELFLPAAGTYVIFMTDSRSLFLDAAGGPEACYYTTIEQIALPAADPGTITDTAGTDTGQLRVISFDPAEGDLIDNLLDDNFSDALAGGLVAMKNGVYVTSSVETNDFFFGPIPAETLTGGLANADTLDIVVDAMFNYALEEQPYILVTNRVSALALPTAGTSVTVTPPGPTGFFGDYSLLYFDVNSAGEIDHWDMTFTDPVDILLIVDAQLNPVAFINDSTFGDPQILAFQDEFVRYLATGRYYLAANRLGALPADTWDVTNTLTRQTASAITTGTLQDDVALPATGSAFLSFDPGAGTWLNVTASSANGGATTSTQQYLLSGFGWLDGNDGFYPALGQYDFDSLGGDVYERIFVGDTNDYLLRVTTSAPAGGTTFDALIDNQAHIALGTLAAGTVTRTGDAFLDFELLRYLGTTNVANEVTITASPNTATPSIDIIMATFDENIQVINFADSGFDGDPEVLPAAETAYPNSPWVTGASFLAFGVGDYYGNPGTVDLDIVTVAPRPYTIAAGAVAFTEICPSQGGSGSVVAMFPDPSGFGALDEGMSGTLTMPFAFQLFGADVADFSISSNGWLGFDPVNSIFADFTIDPIPNAATPNGFFAPAWTDLDYTEICRLDTGTSVRIEWRGETYTGAGPGTGAVIEFQVVMHDTGVVDFIYGANQADDGSFSAVGAETTSGGFGHEISSFTSGSVLPSTSQTLTPL